MAIGLDLRLPNLLSSAHVKCSKAAIGRPGNEHQRWLFDGRAAINDPKAPANDFALQVNDVVVIPRSGVANVNVWVEQYLRKNIPINFGMFYPIAQ